MRKLIINMKRWWYGRKLKGGRVTPKTAGTVADQMYDMIAADPANADMGREEFKQAFAGLTGRANIHQFINDKHVLQTQTFLERLLARKKK